MRRSLKLIPATAIVLCSALPAFAGFNGTYSGSISLAPGAVESETCVAAPMTVTVDDSGKISAPGVDGFVNDKAFITGKVKVADRSMPIEGRLVEDSADNQVHISAGVIDDQSGCSWSIDLVKR